MGNRQSTTQHEQLIDHPMPENIIYDVRVPFKFDLVMYFEFSLNQSKYDFKIFIKINEGFDYCYRYNTDSRKANPEQRRLKLDPILRIKHLCDEDYTIEVYNADELILDTVVNLDVRYKKANYTGM
jgi:hypothetical protein